MKNNKTSSMNNSEIASLVQGPLTVTCMFETYLSQFTLWLQKYGQYKPLQALATRAKRSYVRLGTWRPTAQFPWGVILVRGIIEETLCFCSKFITRTSPSADDCTWLFTIMGDGATLCMGSSWLQALASWNPTTLVAFHSKWHSSTPHIHLVIGLHLQMHILFRDPKRKILMSFRNFVDHQAK
jgi:hypothetical protein